MTFRQILYALAVVLALSIGQVLFKQASVKFDIVGRGLLSSVLFNVQLLAGLMIYAIATFAWLSVIKEAPLRIAYPFAALAFVMVPILAHFFLGEPLSIRTFLGAMLIIIGVYVSVM